MNLGKKIGQIKGLHKEILNNVYEGTWGGYTVFIVDLNKSFESLSGIKTMNLPVLIKAKDGILTIHKK